MNEVMKLVYCILGVLMLFTGPAFSAPDEDPVASKKAKKSTTVIAKTIDSDNDGVPDDEDECPNIPGLVATKGCPDSDGDGIPDHLDDCPSIAGLSQFKGCPDSDLDGIPDNKDVCPYEAGSASNNGCPEKDTIAKETLATKGTRVIDTISLDEERSLQIMRYERYVAEQELKRQEYITRLANSNKSNAGTVIETPSAGETKPPVITGNIADNNVADNAVKEDVEPKEVIAVVETPANPLITHSTVKIDNAMYQSYKPKLEELLQNMRFQDGRVRFLDENKFFDALSKLASYCNTYPEWNVTLRCYSNETDNAYGNKQLFSNRVHVLKQILIEDLHVSDQRLTFINNISHTSEISNFISLEITVK
jgi:hypothetical protein